MGSKFTDRDDIHEEPGLLQSDDSAWKEYNLLSLDGGGIRGYWSLLALNKLMEYIADAEMEDDTAHSFAPEVYPENVSQVPRNEREQNELKVAQGDDKCLALYKTRRYLPCHYFDYICGSSTGALIAIMLGRFRMTVLDCLQEYGNLGGEIFGKPRFFTQLRFLVIETTKYKGAKLKKVFEDVTARRSEQVMGADSRVTFPSGKGLCRTFVTTLKSGPSGQAASSQYLIRSYDHCGRTSSDAWRRSKRGLSMFWSESNSHGGDQGGLDYKRRINYENAQTFQIWEVARAATAAPWYFEPLKIKTPGRAANLLFTDGGFSYNNNPTEEGTLEIEERYGPSSIGVVVSVGTAREIIPSPRRGMKRKVEHMGYNLSDPEINHERMKAKSGEKGFRYYRLNEPGGLSIQLDEWEPREKLYTKNSGQRTLDTIRTAFANWAAKTETTKLLQECASELVRRRRLRTNNFAKWERYATGAQFRCPVRGCDGEDFINRTEFEHHLTGNHKIPNTKLKQSVDDCRDHWRYQEADTSGTRQGQWRFGWILNGQ